MSIEWTREYSQKVSYKWCIAAEAQISGRRLRVALNMNDFVYVASLDGTVIPDAASPEMRDALAKAEEVVTALLASGGTLPIEVASPPPPPPPPAVVPPKRIPMPLFSGVARTEARQEMAAKIKAAGEAKAKAKAEAAARVQAEVEEIARLEAEALAKAKAKIEIEVLERDVADTVALEAALEGAQAAEREAAEAEATASALISAEDAARLEAETAALARASIAAVAALAKAEAARKARFVPVPKPVPGQPEVARFKVQYKANARRIWLDGARLTRAGFIGGTEYRYTVEPGRIVCMLLSPEEAAERAASKRGGAGFRRVTGRPEGKPLIDMVGKDVVAAFPMGDLLHVVFEPGRITITMAED